MLPWPNLVHVNWEIRISFNANEVIIRVWLNTWSFMVFLFCNATIRNKITSSDSCRFYLNTASCPNYDTCVSRLIRMHEILPSHFWKCHRFRSMWFWLRFHQNLYQKNRLDVFLSEFYWRFINWIRHWMRLSQYYGDEKLFDWNNTACVLCVV